ncbi:ORFL305W [Human betaherpesvirus 5]|nr:ORFL305W [Human betaherpesvirus 5]
MKPKTTRVGRALPPLPFFASCGCTVVVALV